MDAPSLEDTMPDNERLTWAIQAVLPEAETVKVPYAVMVKSVDALLGLGDVDGNGAVTTKEVAEALNKQFGVKVDKRKITMADIKAHGSYTAEVKLHTGVVATITVVVSE